MIMNKILYALLALLCIGVTACDNDDEVTEIASLNIVKATVDFSAMEGDGYIALENGDSELKAVSNVEWCKIKEITDDKVTFSVTPNEGLTTRAAAISISIPGEEKRVGITQAGVVSEYDSDNFYSFADNLAFNKTINFTSTLPVTVSIEDAAKTWLSYQKIEGGYVFAAEANETGSARFGNVTITSGRTSIDYYFLQYGLDDLLGTWNASYSTGEADETDVIAISETVNGLNLSMQNLGYPRIKAVYQEGTIEISCMQMVGEVPQRFYLYWGALDSRNQPVIDSKATCRLTPYLNEHNQWGLTFVDNGSWKYGMKAMAVCAVNPSSFDIAGFWDIIYNLSLYK